MICPRHPARNIPPILYCISSSVGLHSSVSGTTSCWNGVSACEITSLRLYFRTIGAGSCGERGWSSEGGINFSDCFALRFLGRCFESCCCELVGKGRLEPMVMCDDCLIPFRAVRRELWKLVALKSPKEAEESVLLATILPCVASEATDTGAYGGLA